LFAAERTLLSRVGTGPTVLAFGLLVARFGLFLRIAGRRMGSDPRSTFYALAAFDEDAESTAGAVHGTAPPGAVGRGRPRAAPAREEVREPDALRGA